MVKVGKVSAFIGRSGPVAEIVLVAILLAVVVLLPRSVPILLGLCNYLQIYQCSWYFGQWYV